MQWNDFLDKIRTYKKEYAPGQVDLRATSLVTLLYAGGFDSMLGKAKIDAAEYRVRATELLKALGSTAQLPKAKKTDLIGIDKISSNLDLNLWRSETNPTYTFDIADLFSTFLSNLNFTKNYNADIIYRRPPNYETKKPEILVFKNFNTIFKEERYASLTKKNSPVLVGIIGIIRDFRIRKTKTGKEMASLRLFTGSGLSPIIYIWSDGEEFIPYAKTQHIKNGKSGIAVVRPGFWQRNPQFTLMTFLPTNEKTEAK